MQIKSSTNVHKLTLGKDIKIKTNELTEGENSIQKNV